MVDYNTFIQLIVLGAGLILGLRTLANTINTLGKNYNDAQKERMILVDELVKERVARAGLQIELANMAQDLKELKERVRDYDAIKLTVSKLETENLRLTNEAARREQMIHIFAAQKHISDNRLEGVQDELTAAKEQIRQIQKSTQEISLE